MQLPIGPIVVPFWDYLIGFYEPQKGTTLSVSEAGVTTDVHRNTFILPAFTYQRLGLGFRLCPQAHRTHSSSFGDYLIGF